MPLVLTREGMRAIFPRAPQAVVDAFATNQGSLAAAGILATKNRLLFATSNVEHECGGFTITNLTENINYTAQRMHEVWPNRFASADAVRQKFGAAPGWQKKAFDDIYGNRMGNRPGTSDGSKYIGRGGPQVTGRDGYAEVGKRCGLDLVNNPELASAPEHQPAILAGFWAWKNLNHFADANDFEGCVKVWNGGTNGMADRLAQKAGNNPIIQRMELRDQISAVIQPAPVPTKEPEKTAGKTAVVVGGVIATSVAVTRTANWQTAAVVIVAGIIVVAAILVFWSRRK